MKIKQILLSGLAAAAAITSTALAVGASEIYSYNAASGSELTPTVGVEVDYRTQNQIRSYLEKHPFSTSSSPGYSTSPDLESPYENAGALNSTTLTEGLNALNCMRYIAGLPEVTLDSSYSSQCQSGSYVNYLNGAISHSPAKPAGISDSIYNTGSAACGKSNLGMGYTNVADSVIRGYMNDSDASNISRLGHRRWCLNPSMQKTGFGQVGRYQSMYAFDNSFGATSYAGVCWPAQNMPLEYFGNNQAWSYSLGKEISDTSQIRVKLTNLSNNKEWNFSEASADGYFTIENSNYGKPGCVIFRPNSITYSNGDEFLVEIKRLWDDGLYSTIAEYNVDFFSLSPNVTGLKATEKYPDSLKFTWDDLGSDVYYLAEIFDYPTNIRLGYSLLTTNSYTFTNLTYMKQYNVKVTAFYGKPTGCDGIYTGNSGTPQQTTIMTPYGVHEVSDLKATSTSNSVKLSWSWDSKYSYDKFKVEVYKSGKWVHAGYTTGTSFTVKNLNPSTSYKFRVTSLGEDRTSATGLTYGGTSYPVTVSATTKLPPIANFKGTSAAKSVKLTWDKYSSASYYKVFVWENNKYTELTKTASSVLNYTANNLSENTSYKFRVTAYNNSDKAIAYSVMTVKTKCGAVASLNASTTNSSVKLTWNKYAAANYYKIFVSENNKWKLLKQTNNNATLTYTANALKGNTSYKFRVAAYDKSGKAIAYTDITAKTKGKIIGLKSVTSKSAVKLSWNKNSAANCYKVWIWKDSKWTLLTQTKDNSVITYTAKSLNANTSYKFRVTAYNKSGKAIAYTDITAKTKCGQIANLKAAPAKNSVKLTWSKYASTNYCKVFIWKNSKWTLLTQTKDSSVVAYTAKSLTANTSYKFRVTAYDSSGKAIAYTDITTKTTT